MKITEINRDVIRLLRPKIEAALAGIAKEHDLVIKLGAGNFMPTNLTLKLEIATKTEDGEVNSREVEDFKHNAFLYGLKAEDLGKEFTFRGETYMITGLRRKAHKNPILVKRVHDGKVFVMPVEFVTAFSKPKAKRSEKEILEDLRGVESRLSPENLTGDGEIPRSVWQRTERQLRQERANLIVELGREPTTKEIYGF